jgi:hypothetical protein
MLDQLHAAVRGENALHFSTILRADDAGDPRPDGSREPSIVAPATYAPNQGSGQGGGPRINVVRCADRVEVRTVLSSVGAEAHRHKASLRAGLDEDPTLPFPRVNVAGVASAQEWALDILDLPHGASDAYLRYTTEWDEFDPFVMQLGQLDLRDDVSRLYERCVHMLLVGGWASYHRSAARLPRTLTATIDGVTIFPGARSVSDHDARDEVRMHIKAQRTDPLVKGEQIALPDSIAKNLKKSEKKNVSRIGIGDIPAKGFSDRVLIDYAVAKFTISLAGIRHYRFPIDGKPDRERDLAGRTVITALGLVMHELAMRRGFFLRSGCSLVPENSTRVLITATGEHKPLPWDADGDSLETARTLYRASVEAAQQVGLRFSDPRTLHASDELNAIIAASSRLQAEEEEAA